MKQEICSQQGFTQRGGGAGAEGEGGGQEEGGRGGQQPPRENYIYDF